MDVNVWTIISVIVVALATTALLCALAAVGLAYLTNGEDAAEKAYKQLLAPILRIFSEDGKQS